ncbi:MAG: helix-turn-helix domain-containing protein [Anaerolineae bacterium]|nr:helix-turn-helix domain-containing protein [Anaerolineae bacterium]MCO5188383.1 helix-turn-helix domain-containing protein [Anaerolineae bacterium]MCO5195064.1 helix-turn-helix domain-containing protein [Anaerolineae bacterium]MCO5197252.1 helix-turn-helix domain-containing protein [Anaerolineae bacterium]MCO5204810.1 helix-turn-helix domain-containing protein [Anaerolineae bacterium]
MDRKTFGQLVAALRCAQFDLVDRKRWTQCHLATRANLSPRTIGEIERGDKTIIDAEILVRLADALRLNSTERSQFFALAIPTTKRDVWGDGESVDVPWQIGLRLIEQVQTPAVLHGPVYELLAVNKAWLRLHRLSRLDVVQLNAAGRYPNLLALVFNTASPFKAIFAQQWAQLARQSVEALRVYSFPYRHTAYWRELLAVLTAFPDFARYWQEALQRDEPLPFKVFDYHHPEHGRLHYIVQTAVVDTVAGHLYLSTLSALSEKTQRILQQLVEAGGAASAERFVLWPIYELVRSVAE